MWKRLDEKIKSGDIILSHNGTKHTADSLDKLLKNIKQKGYEVITGATLKNHLVDFVGVAIKHICICMLDKEPGDWLADEERFND